MKPEWIDKVDNEHFSELVHSYHKLAAMRIMQDMREKYDIPRSDMPILICALMSRLLNESCYAIGSNMANGLNICDFYQKEHLLNLINVLNNQPIQNSQRVDIDIKNGLQKFRDFVEKNGQNLKL